MNSEKVNEIKEALECCQDRNYRNCPRFEKEPLQEKSCRFILFPDILTLINELESENAELKRYKLDWLNSEKMHFQAEMEETEFELASSNRLFEMVSKENKQLKERIAELEKAKNEKSSLVQFAERLKEKLNDMFSTPELDIIDETLKEMINETKNP